MNKLTPYLTALLLSLWLGKAAAQSEAPNSIPAARPPVNAANAAAGKTAAAAPATPNTEAPKPADAPKTAADKPAPATTPEPAAPVVPAKKGKKGEEPPPPPPMPQGPLKAPECNLAEFRAIGMDNTDERTRRAKASAWLKKKAPNCSAVQLIVIRNNRSHWMGTADSAGLAALVDGLLESFAETNKDVAILLYGTPPPPPKPKPSDDQKNSKDAAKK